jgi:hypothetical protein
MPRPPPPTTPTHCTSQSCTRRPQAVTISTPTTRHRQHHAHARTLERMHAPRPHVIPLPSRREVEGHVLAPLVERHKVRPEAAHVHGPAPARAAAADQRRPGQRHRAGPSPSASRPAAAASEQASSGGGRSRDALLEEDGLEGARQAEGACGAAAAAAAAGVSRARLQAPPGAQGRGGDPRLSKPQQRPAYRARGRRGWRAAPARWSPGVPCTPPAAASRGPDLRAARVTVRRSARRLPRAPRGGAAAPERALTAGDRVGSVQQHGEAGEHHGAGDEARHGGDVDGCGAGRDRAAAAWEARWRDGGWWWSGNSSANGGGGWTARGCRGWSGSFL